MSNTDTYSPPKLLRVGEVAERFGVTVVTVRTWERQGKLKAIRTPGNQRKFLKDDIDALLTPTTPAESSPLDSAGVSSLPSERRTA